MTEHDLVLFTRKRISIGATLIASLLIWTAQTMAQVQIHERIEVKPEVLSRIRPMSYEPTEYLPCNPPPSPLPPDPPTIWQVALFHDEGAVPLDNPLPPPGYDGEDWSLSASGAEYITVRGEDGQVFELPHDFHRVASHWFTIYPNGTEPDSLIEASVNLTDHMYHTSYTLNIYISKARFGLHVNHYGPVNFGETRQYDTWVLNQCDAGIPPFAPESVTYSLSIESGANYGSLVDTVTHDTAKTLLNLHAINNISVGRIKFIANCDNPDSIGIVRLRFNASDSTIPTIYDTIQVVGAAPGPFAKYRVTFSSDSILHGDTTTVFIAAVDNNNHVVWLPDNTQLNFSIDSSRFGRFINPSGDSIPSPLNGVSYADAKAGLVKFVADGTNPPAPGPVAVSVSVQGGGASGKGSIQVRRVVLKLSVSRAVLSPLKSADNKTNPAHNSHGPDKRNRIIDFAKVDTTHITVIAVDGAGIPLVEYPFKIQALAEDSSGGHSHIVDRPKGKFVTPTGDTVNPAIGKTGADGKQVMVYRSSGFGGQDSLVVTGKRPADTSTAVIQLRIDGLVGYTVGQHDTLVGMTTTHPKNHFVAPMVVTKLRMLADSAYADSSWGMQYNDMSLICGGPFDIKSQYQWDTPHEAHREGRNADLRPTSKEGRAIDKDWLRNIVNKRLHGSVFNEDSTGANHHFHLKF